MTTGTLVVVGAGLTAAAAAQALRSEGYDGRVVLLGDEPHLPYERPPLSKEYLRGETGPEPPLVRPAGWYAEHAVEVRLGVSAQRVLAAERAVELDDGERIVADAVLLATGARPRTLPGAGGGRILSLRTLEDAERIAGHLAPGRHIVLAGTGFVGAEIAASARSRGAEVTAVEMLGTPLEHVLGQEMGAALADLHRERGVGLRTGQRVDSIVEHPSGVVVTTTAGGRLEGDAVVVGVGTVPNTGVAEASGIATENGIVVDEHCRTSLDGVYAAGDVANHFHPLFGRQLRVEHYTSALAQGAAAARSMLGRSVPFDEVPWFWSDQYEHNLQYTGAVERWDEVVVRGSIGDRDFVAFYLRDAVVQAAFGMNRGRDVRAAKRLVARRAAPAPDLLRDERTDLRRL